METITTAQTATTRRALADRLWLAAGIVVVMAAIVALLTMFGPLGTFGEPEPVPAAGAATAPADPVDLGNGLICNQCGPTV
jgi:hypothetical protein